MPRSLGFYEILCEGQEKAAVRSIALKNILMTWCGAYLSIARRPSHRLSSMPMSTKVQHFSAPIGHPVRVDAAPTLASSI